MKRVAGILATLVLASSVWALGDASDSPRYWKLLRPPASSDSLNQPLGVHADLHTGEIFVCDRRNHRVVIFDEMGLYRYAIPGGRVFRTPIDVAVDPAGQIILLAYVGTERRLLELDFDGSQPRLVSLLLPDELERSPTYESVALDASGERLFLLDNANKRAWIHERDGRFIRFIELGADVEDDLVDEQMLTRLDVYADRLLVPDPMFGRALVFDLEGQRLASIGVQGGAPCTTGFPVAAALGSDGTVYLLDQQKTLVSAWTPEGNRCLGEIGSIGRSPGAFYKPADLALDGDGRLVVSQGFEGRVQMFLGASPALGGRSMKHRRFERFETLSESGSESPGEDSKRE